MTVKSEVDIPRIASLPPPQGSQQPLPLLGVPLPCDSELTVGAASPLAKPLVKGGLKIGNQVAIHPMEGWDGSTDGNPSESTLRRWRRFGQSGAKLIWGGEAVAVRPEGRANPNQLLMADHTLKGLARLRTALMDAHQERAGSPQEGLLVGLQLTHSGRLPAHGET